jgi:hypothetical protein
MKGQGKLGSLKEAFLVRAQGTGHLEYKSGLMNKHIVKHIEAVHIVKASYLGFGLMLFLGALYPSKSGLMNKHIVKHIGNIFGCPVPVSVRTNEQTYREKHIVEAERMRATDTSKE